MVYAIALLTGLIVFACLLPLSRHSYWMVRSMDFPRLQIATLAFLILIADLSILNFTQWTSWVLVVSISFCFIWQIWWILPYTLLWPKEVKTTKVSDPDREISILTSNVLTPNRNAEALINLVRKHKPDVLVTLESDQWWEDQLSVLENEMPYSVKCPRDNLYGMHVFSHLPLNESTISYLVEDGIPSIHTQIILPMGDSIRAHFVHPAPPSPTENLESSERDAELVIIGRSVADSQQPVIVTGDLNDVAWSASTRLFRKVSGLLDPRVGRGMFNTFHADYFFLRWPLDHLFHSDHFTLKSIQRLPSIDSDHFALFTRLVYVPTAQEEQEGLESEISDQEWADDIVKEEGVSKDEVPKFCLQDKQKRKLLSFI